MEKNEFKEVSYFYNFGDKDGNNCDLADNFSVCFSSLSAMIGIAKYMGFSKAILIGCDYLGLPRMESHFYSDKQPFFSKDSINEYTNSIQLASNGIDIFVILTKSATSSLFSYATYEDYFRVKEKYQENTEFIDEFYIRLLRDASSKNLVYM
ncbi:MAG: hypothetical protein HS129_07030 [Leptospiraceae bacterium]|nr:hypothetical protein [Leptospiraceae bacterium]